MISNDYCELHATWRQEQWTIESDSERFSGLCGIGIGVHLHGLD